MPAQQSIRQKRRRRSDGTVKLNITSMIDMFTLMVVFLIQNYSAQGQLVTPAEGLKLPKSTIEKGASSALTVQIARNKLLLEDRLILDRKGLAALEADPGFLIPELARALEPHARNARGLAAKTGQEFSGKLSIQGDTAIAYNILVKVMYTCGQAGYNNMNMVVYQTGQ